MSTSAQTALEFLPLTRAGHAAHCLRCLSGLPGSQAEADPSKLALAFYCIGSLDLLDLVREKTTADDRERWRKWIWEQQTAGKHGTGFRPSPFMTPGQRKQDDEYTDYDTPHMIMSYTALLSLAILRDDFSRLDCSGLLRFIHTCQRDDGSFSIIPGSNESDLRTLYCAFAISHMLNDWSAINIERATSFIASCRTHEGGYGQAPSCEAHGGTTYIAIASLYLVPDRTPTSLLAPDERELTIRWLLSNQLESGGFGGRTGKEADACYCFWCAAALHILGASSLVDGNALAAFLSECQFRFGGIAKAPHEHPDPYHTYLSLATLSLYPVNGEPTYALKALDPLLNATHETAHWVREHVPSRKE